MEGSQRKKGVRDRRLSIIDVSSADDSLLDPLSGSPDGQGSGRLSENQEHSELIDTPNSKKFEDASSKLEEWEQEPRPNETFEMGGTKKSKCNLRKSLAWDSAFFTSAGVLDPEELSSIIECAEKDEKQALPGIMEDLYMSCESISTLESDSLTLESLDADLFEDIRASIQKSGKMSDVAYGNSKVTSEVAGFQTDDCKQPLPGIKEDVHRSYESISTLESDSLTLESMEANLFDDIRASIQKSGKASDVANKNSLVPSGVVGLQTDDVLKTTAMTFGNKLKASSSKNSSTPSVQPSGRITKNHVRPPVVQKLSARRGEPSTVKQPKLPAKSTPGLTMSTKRASLGGVHVGSERDKTKGVVGSVCSVPKAPAIGVSGGIMPKTTISSKSSSAPSVATKTKPTSTSFGRNSSGNISKSPLNYLKRKVDAGTIKPPASGSAVRTPSKVASRNKTESGNCSLSGLMSVTRLSSSVSPASSISDWSSESSSSTCMSKNRSTSSRTSIESSSCRKVLSDTDKRQVSSSLNSPSDSRLEGQETQIIGSVSQCASARSISAGTVLPSAPTRPSGLRMPSPKIGFFDGMKSSGRTPRGGMQSHTVVPRGLPHGGSVGASASEGQNKANLGKVQPPRSNLSIKNAQPNNQQTSRPNPVHESLGVAVMTSSTLQNVGSSSEMSMEVPDKTVLENTAGNVSNMTEGRPVGMQDLNLDLIQNIGTADEKPNKSDSSFTRDVENPSREIVGGGPRCGKVDLPKVEGPFLHEAIVISMDKPSPKGTNDVPSLNSIDNILMVGQHNPSISSATEIDSLSCQLEALDIQRNFDSHSLSCSLSDVNSQDNLNLAELSSCKEHLDCPKEEESFNGPNSRGPCSPAHTRRPFAVKDSFCNMDGLFRVSTESSVAEVKSNLSLPHIMSKEN